MEAELGAAPDRIGLQRSFHGIDWIRVRVDRCNFDLANGQLEVRESGLYPPASSSCSVAAGFLAAARQNTTYPMIAAITEAARIASDACSVC